MHSACVHDSRADTHSKLEVLLLHIGASASIIWSHGSKLKVSFDSAALRVLIDNKKLVLYVALQKYDLVSASCILCSTFAFFAHEYVESA